MKLFDKEVIIKFNDEAVFNEFVDYFDGPGSRGFDDHLESVCKDGPTPNFDGFMAIRKLKGVYRAMVLGEDTTVSLTPLNRLANPAPGVPLPDNFPLAVGMVMNILDKKNLAVSFQAMPESEATASLHDTLGRYIRNNWGLWSGNSALWVELNSLGFSHPDDMSSIILTCAHREYNKKFWCVAQEAEKVRGHYNSLEAEQLSPVIEAEPIPVEERKFTDDRRENEGLYQFMNRVFDEIREEERLKK